MVLQRTRYERLQRQLGDQVQPVVDGPWKRRSLGALSLLLGFFLGSNLTTYYLEKIGQRPVVVLVLVLLIEVVVRMRTRVQSAPWPLGWVLLDNLRIGVVYAVVLEAYKLGS
ncbi:DUF565 domain-containing protein [Synechococcus sp. RS9916]|uniref:DUF565 domain-containing protein n=1 Tax=Synechococcus sp. RS9916 TaxID=221359 RepID=UPI0000E53FA0|nr:DUF565 domain-containing protein [Synechococcus sp. RS9916]EAU73870.1 hypothetical protein RS9916_30214 [Synechococcus sp. RS9916]